MCSLVKSKKSIYLSAHVLGKAFDFNAGKLTSKEMNQVIRYNSHRFKYPIRLEKNTNGWCHVDVYQPIDSKANLIEFKG